MSHGRRTMLGMVKAMNATYAADNLQPSAIWTSI